MRAVIQRVKHAEVIIASQSHASISHGLLVLLGVEASDTNEDLIWLCNKIVSMRIFSDQQGLMNQSVQDVAGEILLVSQFTLFAQTKKGNRPSFIQAAKPEIAIPIYEQTIAHLTQLMPTKIKTGVFGADMELQLSNDGPVTIIMDTNDKERH
jgi:D-tyrosyl-tRNA(Tyr) deacylase